MDRRSLIDYLQPAAAQIDPEPIIARWEALADAYRIEDRQIPIPVWARRTLDHDGPQAWRTLQEIIPRLPDERAFCIYLHIPFCSRRCSYCDCYAFPLRNNREKHIDSYLSHLETEIAQWAVLGNLARRPVSTVHLGGGTPTYPGMAAFTRLIEACRAAFHTTARTEWALETTSSELNSDTLYCLDELGFTRLHVGVQSLENTVRQAINRQETGEQVLEKLTQAIRPGWIVSVDLIVGLPGQTLTSLLEDIRILCEIGIDGFSIYQLQISPRNRHFAQQHQINGQSRLPNYLMLQAAAQQLAGFGFQKTLFNHFAGQRDTNLYFTFPERGEDCLALGTIADGVFEDYHYRHPEYVPYGKSVGKTFPGLQGGLRRTALENRIRPLETALLSARLDHRLFAERLGEAAAGALFDHWCAVQFIQPDRLPGHYRLTENGSWFTGNMMAALCCMDD